MIGLVIGIVGRGDVVTRGSHCELVSLFLETKMPDHAQHCILDDGERIIENIMGIIIDQPEFAVLAPEMREILTFNVFGGKFWRGIFLYDTAKAILGDAFTPEHHDACALVAYAAEIIQAAFLVADDVMDAAVTRRGRPCWYKRPEIGLRAVNDAFLLESVALAVIGHVEDHHGLGATLTRVVQRVVRCTEMGQMMDINWTVGQDDVIFDSPSTAMERCTSIHTCKTSYYTFYMPLALGQLLGTALSTPSHPVSSSITTEVAVALPPVTVLLGRIFQIQDDVMDIFTPSEVLGKIGTDVQDGKCSWPLAVALADIHAAGESGLADLATLKECINTDGDDATARVREIYQRRGISEKFDVEVAQLAGEARARAGELSETMQTRVEAVLGKMIGRKW